MSKKYVDLSNVRLSYDSKADVVRISSSDPRLKGAPFALQLKAASETDVTARKLLIAEGVELTNSTPLEFHRPTYKSSHHPSFVPLGANASGDPVLLEVSDLSNKNYNPLTLISGRPGAGKSCLMTIIAKHFLAFNDKYDIFYTSVSPYWARPFTKTFEISQTASPGPRSLKRRVVLIDGFIGNTEENSGSAAAIIGNALKIIEDAKRHGDIVFLSTIHARHWEELAGSRIIFGDHDPFGHPHQSDRTGFGPLKNGQAVLRQDEDGSRSNQLFNVHKAFLQA